MNTVLLYNLIKIIKRQRKEYGVEYYEYRIIGIRFIENSQWSNIEN